MSNNFEHKHLSQLCTLLNGLAFKPEDWSEYGHPIIRIQNLNGSSDFNFCNRAVPSQYMIPPDTVLFSWSGNRGTSFGPYWWKGPSGVLNQHIFKVSPKPDIYLRWLYYSLDLARQEAEQQAHGGSGLVHVRRTDLLKYKIPTPPPPEQRRIAEILDTIHEAIQKTKALISKLKAMKQGLLHDLLTRGLDKNGKLRDPKTHPEQFKDSLLGRIPKEWEVDKLGKVCRRSGGSVQTGPFGSQLHASDYRDSGTPIITVEHLGDNEIIHNNLPLVGRMDYERLVRYRLETGDLVFSRVGAIDRCAYVSEEENGWLFSGRCLRVRTGGKLVNSRFLSFQLTSYESRQWILNHSVGSTMACLNTSILSEVPMSFPPIQEQRAIALVLDAHDSRIRTEEQYRDKLKLQKKGLMHDLLTGKVRVKV